MATAWPFCDKYKAVAQPQYPSPPSTAIFIWLLILCFQPRLRRPCTGFCLRLEIKIWHQEYNVLKAWLETNTTIIAVIRPRCKHLISKSQKFSWGRKTPLCLAKDDW